jgi:NADH-ubiquinone oxidoreductase chain 5
LICSLLFIGAMGKSAQIGLHTWLPDAMEGPTPVSALIHAATMVTAGVFLIIKCSPIFEYVPTVLSFITFIGAMTAFFSATIGLVQNDIKKVIAYSTCSQLGYMIFACGLSNYHVSLFHLANHAFFKALLFLSAGAIIHSLSNEQDMRKFGGLALLLPYTSIMLLIGSLSLMGFPFLTGFYSKDLILELALTKYTIEGSFAYSLGLITAFFTSFYSFRVFYLTFIYKNNSFRKVISHVHELPLKMAISLAVLSLGSIFLGYVAKDLFVGLGTDFWNHSILILPEHNNQLDAEFFGLPNLATSELQSFWNRTYTQRWIKLLPFFLSLAAVTLVCFFYASLRPISWWPNLWKENENLAILFNQPFIFKNKITDSEKIVHWHTKGTISNSKDWSDLHKMLSRKGKSKKERRDLFELTHMFHLHGGKSSVTNYQIFLQALSKSEMGIWNSRSIDDPLLPSVNTVKNDQYLHYQKLIWDLHYNREFTAKSNYKNFLRAIYRFLTYKWYFDAVYNELLNRPLIQMAYTTVFRSLDKGVLELFGPYGISKFLFLNAPKTKQIQLGKVYYYGYLMIMFIFVSLVVLNSFN